VIKGSSVDEGGAVDEMEAVVMGAFGVLGSDDPAK
jgi:hypothetical protein